MVTAIRCIVHPLLSPHMARTQPPTKIIDTTIMNATTRDHLMSQLYVITLIMVTVNLMLQRLFMIPTVGPITKEISTIDHTRGTKVTTNPLHKVESIIQIMDTTHRDTNKMAETGILHTAHLVTEFKLPFLVGHIFSNRVDTIATNRMELPAIIIRVLAGLHEQRTVWGEVIVVRNNQVTNFQH